MRRAILLLGVLLTGVAAGCQCIMGLGVDVVVQETSGAGTTTGTSGTGGTGGAAGTGGTGGTGGAIPCTPGEKVACYAGPAGTENIGNCKAGTQTCDEMGSGFGGCEGEVLPGPEKPDVPGDEGCDGYKPGEALWSRLWGDAGEQDVVQFHVNPAGELVLYGFFAGSLAFTDPPLISPSSTPYLVGLDADGIPISAVKDVPHGPQGYFWTIDGQGYLLQGLAPPFEVAKTDLDGNDVWDQNNIISNQLFPAHMAVDAVGDVVIAGYMNGSVDLGGGNMLASNGGSDALILKLTSAEGWVSFARNVGGASNERGTRIAVGPAPTFALAGKYDGFLFYANNYDVTDGDDDLFIMGGDFSDPNAGWAKGFGGTWYGHDLAVDSLGAVVVVGRVGPSGVNFGGGTLAAQGQADLVVVKLNAAGDHVWSKRFGSAMLEPSGDVKKATARAATDKDGDVIIAFEAKGTVNFGGGPLGAPGAVSEFLVKVDKTGELVWARSFGPVTGPTPNVYGFTPDGCLLGVTELSEVLLACTVNAPSVDFGAGVLTGKGGPDIVVAKFAP